MAKTILHIAEAHGGVERYLVTLLTKFKIYPEYEHILVCSSCYDTKKFEGLVKDIFVVDSMRNAISFKYDFKAIVSVRRIIKKINPDIIYCHSSKAGAVGRIANVGVNKKLIYNPHGWAFNIKSASSKKSKVYEIIERLFACMADRIVCISEYEKKSALAHRICKEEKLVVINNGIDFDEYKKFSPKSRTELGIPEGAFVVGMIGRLTMQKAPDIFVQMASIVKKSIPESFFVIVGDDIGGGDFHHIVEKQIEENSLSNSFLITGWVDNPLDYASCFDVATLLSRWEGFGLVLPEYMLLGKPIVATKADAIPYVVGDAGIIVDIDDYESASKAVLKIYKDNLCRKKLIFEGNKRLELFNAKRTADEHVLYIFN